MQQAAWLGAELDEQPGLASQGAEKKTRLDRDREKHGEDYQPPMPPIEDRFLIDCLNDIGPGFAAGGMGPAMVETELLNWQANTGFELEPWQSRMLKRLSVDHYTQRQKSTKPNCPAPWVGVEQKQENRAAVAQRTQNIFRGTE